MAQIDELKAIKDKLEKAWEYIHAVECDMPEAATDFEMALDEGYDAVMQMTKDMDDLIKTLEQIIKGLNDASTDA